MWTSLCDLSALFFITAIEHFDIIKFLIWFLKICLLILLVHPWQCKFGFYCNHYYHCTRHYSPVCSGMVYVASQKILGFIIRATTKVISRPCFCGLTWRDGDLNLEPPGCRSCTLPLSYIPSPAWRHRIKKKIRMEHGGLAYPPWRYKSGVLL